MRQRTVLIRYTERLGDVVRVLPIARHFAARGWSAFVQCKAAYHGIFDAVSYATPTEDPVEAEKLFNLTIWPCRYASFIESGKTWADFVYGECYPELAPIDRHIVFDRINDTPDPRKHYHLPSGYSIVSPFGYSQRNQYPLGNVLVAASQRMDPATTYVLCDGAQRMWLRANGYERLRLVTMDSPGHLPRLLRDAAEVLTTNSAPAHIAAAVRASYFHLPEDDPQNNLVCPNQVVVTI